MGPVARAPRGDGGGDQTPRAPDSHLSRERGGARGAARARAGEGGDSPVMKRREVVRAVGRTARLAGGGGFVGPRAPPFRPLFLPPDETPSGKTAEHNARIPSP